MITTATGDALSAAYRPSPDPDDHALAHQLAAAAGALLLDLRADPSVTDRRAEGDRRSNEHLLDRLADARPADAVLSEESADSPARLDADRVWIVDPLDGTREYAEGRADWAVHVALWADGALAAGAVAVLALDQVFSTWRPAAIGGDPDPRVMLVSRTRPPAFVPELARRWDSRVTPMGSAGAKTVAVLAGSGTAYVHAGGQYEWDSAAPVAVALAAGLRVRRLDGSLPRYNQADPSLPDVVICRPSCADPLWAALDAVLEEGR